MSDPFRHSDKVFVAGENRVYKGELPPHLAHTDVSKDVARTGLFKLISREGNMLHFKTGNLYTTSCSGKVLTNLQTGSELCFVEYKGSRIRLEASYYMPRGRKLTEKELDTYRIDDGRTLRQFFDDEKAKLQEKRR